MCSEWTLLETAQAASLSHSFMERPYTDSRSSKLTYFPSSSSLNTSFTMLAKYFPLTMLSVFMKTSLSLDSPMGLYLALNLSNLWKVFLSCKNIAK